MILSVVENLAPSKCNGFQVCDLRGHFASYNRTQLAEQMDDVIWKNLSMCVVTD